MWNVKSEPHNTPHTEPAAPSGGTSDMVRKLCEEYEAQITKLEGIIVDQERRLHEAAQWIMSHSSKEDSDAFLASSAISRHTGEEP